MPLHPLRDRSLPVIILITMIGVVVTVLLDVIAMAVVAPLALVSESWASTESYLSAGLIGAPLFLFLLGLVVAAGVGPAPATAAKT